MHYNALFLTTQVYCVYANWQQIIRVYPLAYYIVFKETICNVNKPKFVGNHLDG